MDRAREARSGTPKELQPLEAPPIGGLEVLGSSREYVPRLRRFPAPGACDNQIDSLPEFIFRLDRQFPLLRHRADIGDFPALVRYPALLA